MPNQHKWHKEIKAWADGAEIEMYKGLNDDIWDDEPHPNWHNINAQFRIKPQPKEPQYPFKGMCEIPYKHWVLRFYQMPNDLWYSEGMDDAWMKEMVEASKPQPKEPQYLYVYQGIGELVLETSNTIVSNMERIGKIKLEVDDD